MTVKKKVAKKVAPRRKKVAAKKVAPKQKKVAAKKVAPKRKKIVAKKAAPKRKKAVAKKAAPKRKKVATKKAAPKRKKIAAKKATPKRKKVATKKAAPKRKKAVAKKAAPQRKKTTAPAAIRFVTPVSTPVPKRIKRNIPRWQKTSKLHYLMLTLITFLSIFPFYWMFIVSSNTDAEISKSPPSLVPGPRFLEVAHKVLTAEGVYFSKALINTFVVGIAIAVAQVIFSAIAGFAFAKLNFKGRQFSILFVIATMMLPSQLGIVPLFIMANKLHLVNTLYALIVPALVTAFGVFWMRQIIDAQVPNEILEAASIDGASVPRVFWSIVLPSIRQSSFVLGLFAFLAAWNDYLWPTIVLQSPEKFTLQVALTQLKPLYGLDYSLQMGGAFLATAPLLILFIFVGRRLVSGVMDGAIKG
ncbi:MAG: carbohydrate ABC transporter permease [Actinobacteria bacterium]|nr:carbohydrate ABC transporter permease [Actinomycetota bacterium]